MSVNNVFIENQPCGHKLFHKPSCFVIRLPIKEQLIYFVKNHGLSSPEAKNPSMRGDVTSGSLYTQLREQGVLSDTTITLQLNADGAQSFKKSKFGFWPLMGLINEVSYKFRRNNIILLSLRFGDKKTAFQCIFGLGFCRVKRFTTKWTGY